LSVEMVSNGQLACEKALEAARRGKPFDLILMDVQMPVMDGFTATLQLRGKGYRGPVIALTANAMERDRSKLLGAGCNDFVTKPIQMRDLFKAIGRYLKVVEIIPEPVITQEAAAAAANRAILAQQFYKELPGELALIELAIQREDRVQIEEITRLMLGKAAAAGLKDLAPQIARLLLTMEKERSPIVLRQAVAEFARDSQPQSQSQAA
jgi:CheY-like chemotaxis protein